MTSSQAPASAVGAEASPLQRLAAYRERREALHDDVRSAVAAGATLAEVSRVSGLSRQWVARIVADTVPPEGE